MFKTICNSVQVLYMARQYQIAGLAEALVEWEGGNIISGQEEELVKANDSQIFDEKEDFEEVEATALEAFETISVSSNDLLSVSDVDIAEIPLDLDNDADTEVDSDECEEPEVDDVEEDEEECDNCGCVACKDGQVRSVLDFSRTGVLIDQAAA